MILLWMIPLVLPAIAKTTQLQEDLLLRVEQYKNATFEAGCSWWTDILRLHFHHPNYCEDGILDEVLEVDDFEMAGVAWLVMREWENPLLSFRVKNSLLSRLTMLPFWLDEAGSFMHPHTDGHMEYWSENHQMGWNCGSYLVGHGFSSNPGLQDIVFNGVNDTGHVLYEKGKQRMWRWLDSRYRFGFSEYNADTYAPIAFNPLVTVAALAPDRELKTLAEMVTFLQLYDWILAAHKGIIGSPRGRAYPNGKLLEEGAKSQSIHSILWLLTGEGTWGHLGRKDVVMLILAMEEGFTIPDVLLEVSESLKVGEHQMRERFAISSSVDEAGLEGIGFSSVEDCIFWFGNGGYFSPTTARCLFIVGDAFQLWDRHPIWQQISPFTSVWNLNPEIIDQAGQLAEAIGGGPVLGRSNVYTWRDDGVMMSSVQDYHGGMMAGQQHAWQLTLDPDVTRAVFTTQPTNQATGKDTYWTGGILPRIGQINNTLIAIYNPALINNMVFSTNMTHAHFYRGGFEEVVEVNQWIFGKHEDTYIALYSHQPYDWTEQGEFVDREVVADGERNVWICHVGKRETSGEFEHFVQEVSVSEIEVTVTTKDSLAQCLVDCLDGGLVNLVNCLSKTCRMENHLETSKVAQCLMENQTESIVAQISALVNKDGRNHEDWKNYQNWNKENNGTEKKQDMPRPLLECLSLKEDGLMVRWVYGEKVFKYGWNSPLMVGEKIIEQDYFPRYHNHFSRTEWGSQTVDVELGDHFLKMDFDKIQYSVN